MDVLNFLLLLLLVGYLKEILLYKYTYQRLAQWGLLKLKVLKESSVLGIALACN